MAKIADRIFNERGNEYFVLNNKYPRDLDTARRRLVGEPTDCTAPH
ncbi:MULTISPECIES: hypothetical protein [Ensifer]|jgi:hypothetical protein|uniref:Uncharacterized protein n=1 Tax=Ensifer canadensis TaxID=555315 RepID=A0AAW4FHW5_9HYPH|nr:MULTISPECIES: hypothetical protein [Ensifer]MBM3090626.1 hypothetical protein [Ensifer canadensis]UBI80751.1 hypothetical protein J3R84_34430 [Ensifer canadensis]